MEPERGRAVHGSHAWSAGDSSLASRMAAGDAGALAELYDSYSGRAFGLAYRVLGDAAAAEDVVHDAFLWMWEQSARVDAKRGHPGALLLTVTHRRAVDAVRRRRRGEAAVHSLDHDGTMEDGAAALIESLEEAELVGQIRKCLAAMAPEQREVVELAYYGGMTQDEIAKSRAVPLGTVKSRLRLAMKKLRSAMKVEGP